MPRPSSNSAHRRTGLHIVVAGDKRTGKSSLIRTATTNKFEECLTSVLPPQKLPIHKFPDRVPTTIIDTSSRSGDRDGVYDELLRADAIILTYACDRPNTLESLSTFWLPCLRKLEVKVPIIVVGCKVDLRFENQLVSLEQAMSLITQQFCEIKACIECSAYRNIKSVELTNKAIDFLEAIFDRFDGDFDGILQPCELEELFSTAPESPWIEASWEDAVERNAFGGLSLDAFLSKENKKFLVLKEISKGGVTKLLANKESLASCDVAVFVHDRSDESSWKESYKLLVKIARHGEDTGFEVPCLIVEAKYDTGFDSVPMAIQEAARVFFINCDCFVKLSSKCIILLHQTFDMPMCFVVCAAVVIGVAAARKNLSRKNDKCSVNRSWSITKLIRMQPSLG
ncbi:hypothetical protein TSUD_238090 [Trifolium subterraneum]|uniref:Uncharacterized protein n=1 Tax=Trifolium subterraneum TaxID=3900 RepID=A0A2Z6PWE7_TRISU|nr:hypothetical protein TSUD_238090 [Trifolium subterraneum]